MKQTPLTCTPEQLENLKRLADYLANGNLLAEFDMGSYAEDSFAARACDCGTIGCAAGHGPYAGIPKRTDERWAHYVYRCFLPDMAGNSLEVFYWLFSPIWANTDNTPQGAAKRIYYALEYGVPVDHGYNPAIYDTPRT